MYEKLFFTRIIRYPISYKQEQLYSRSVILKYNDLIINPTT